MPAIGLRTLAGDMTFDEVRKYMRDNPLHQLDMPPEVIELIIKGIENEPDGMQHSPSRILSCHRQAMLAKDNDYYINLDFEYASLRGTLIHSGIEHTGIHRLPVVQEDRVTTMIETKYGPQPFTAKSDCIVILYDEMHGDGWTVHVKIQDYKTTGEIGHDFTRAHSKHQMQVNCYAYVVTKEAQRFFGKKYKNPVVIVDELEIDYFGFTKARRFTSAGTLVTKGRKPKGAKEAEQLELQPIRLLPMEKVEQFIRARIEKRIEEDKARQLPPPLAGDDAKWCFRCPLFVCCQVTAESV